MPCAQCATSTEPGVTVCPQCGVALTPTSATQTEPPALFADSNPDRDLQGIGGWLILVAIGLVISPLRVMRAIFDSNLPFLMNPKHQLFLAKHPAYHVLLLFEVATNICYLVIAAGLVFLFFKKKRGFSTYMILSMTFHFVVYIAVFFTSHILLHAKYTEQSKANILGATLGLIIWIPYLLVSRRVKVTFVH